MINSFSAFLTQTFYVQLLISQTQNRLIRDKLKKKYPGVNVTAIQTLYGLNVSPMAQDCNNRSISKNFIDTTTNSGLVCRIRIFCQSVPFCT